MHNWTCLSIYVQGVAGGLLAPDSLLQPLPCPALLLLLLCRLLVSCFYLLVALQTNGCCALVVLVVYEQQDHVQHAECSRHIVATLALLFAGHLQPSGACFVLD